MEKQESPQLDLFSQGSEASGSRSNQTNPFLARIWNYEKTILIILAILVTGIVAFSLGVEKGKENVSNSQESALVPAKALKAQQPAPQLIVRKEEAAKPVINPAMQQSGSFTIQVATFKTKANALKEAEFIKKRGLGPILFSKNGYFILCVGNFPRKESALGLLAELNKRYGNCQIRRL